MASSSDSPWERDLILTAENICKTFGKVKAVDRVSLNIGKGRITGFLGPNGAGKTTVIRMVMDIQRPDSGRIALAAELNAGRRGDFIGYLPEERGLYLDTRVAETLLYFARLKGLAKAVAREHVAHFLQRFGMTETAQQKIQKLSKGNQQKIQLIAALVAKPALLILDEPFSGLDPINTALVAGCIRELRDSGVSIILATHQMSQAEDFCQNIYLFNRGRVILEGDLGEIISHHSGQFMVVETDGPLPESPHFEVIESDGRRHKIAMADGWTNRDLLAWLAQQEFSTRSVAPFRVPLAQIFIREVGHHE